MLLNMPETEIRERIEEFIMILFFKKTSLKAQTLKAKM